MKKITLIFSITFLITFCNEKKIENTIETKTNSKVIKKEIKEISCKCFDGIGSSKDDTPILELNFSSGQRISICGFLDKEMEGIIISEFNVFECNSGKPLAEYDATQICRIIEKPDTLLIQELKYLPTGKNWDWNLIQIAEQIITTKDKKIFVSEKKLKLEKFNIDENEATLFLNSLKKGKGYSNEWELEIGKLEALTILGNEKAKYILENYENFIGKETDGAMAETWKDAKSTASWVKK